MRRILDRRRLLAGAVALTALLSSTIAVASSSALIHVTVAPATNLSITVSPTQADFGAMELNTGKEHSVPFQVDNSGDVTADISFYGSSASNPSGSWTLVKTTPLAPNSYMLCMRVNDPVPVPDVCLDANPISVGYLPPGDNFSFYLRLHMPPSITTTGSMSATITVVATSHFAP